MDGAARIANITRNVVAIGDAAGNFFATVATKIHRWSKHFIGDTLAELSQKINGYEAHCAYPLASHGRKASIYAPFQAYLNAWMFAMPIRHALKCSSGAHQQVFGEMPANQLERDRRTFVGEPGW